MKTKSEPRLSIIIPIGPGEHLWGPLLADLSRGRDQDIEIILCAVKSEPLDFKRKYESNVIWSLSPEGRASQMNHGAQLAKGKYLWFVHADSRFNYDPIPVLLNKLERLPDSLLYFDLRFLKDGPALMRINEWGVWFRSRVLGIPFGDQGMVLKGELFRRIGGFKEEADYGEDHLFVWAARHLGISLHSVGYPIFTSARKYNKYGQAQTTLHHMWLTFRQAAPEFFIGLKCSFIRGKSK